MIARFLDRKAAPTPPEVIFLGDSITAFWRGGDPRLFGPGRIDRGVPGETSADMRARFARDVLAPGPRAVHIMGGTNDLWHGSPGPGGAATLGELVTMAAAAEQHGIRAILAAPPPVGPPSAAGFAHLELLAPLREALRVQCRAYGFTFVDYWLSLAGDDGAIRPEYTTDGVHLSARGYRAIHRQATRAIAAALARAAA